MNRRDRYRMRMVEAWDPDLKRAFCESISHPHTLEEVGREMGFNRERARQIEAKALRMLRHPSRSRRLRPWLEYDPPMCLPRRFKRPSLEQLDHRNEWVPCVI